LGLKFKHTIKECENLRKEELIILTDSADVLVNGSPDEFIKSWKEFTSRQNETRLIVSSEKACCVAPLQYKKNRPGNFIAEDGKRLERAVFDPDEPLDDTAQTFWTDAMKRMKALELGDSNPYDFDFLNSGMIVGDTLAIDAPF
jgi:hypothetical protein